MMHVMAGPVCLDINFVNRVSIEEKDSRLPVVKPNHGMIVLHRSLPFDQHAASVLPRSTSFSRRCAYANLALDQQSER
jgi:hypothetical protein